MTTRKFLFSLLGASLMGGTIALGGFQFFSEGAPEDVKSLEQKQNVVLSKYYKGPDKNEDYVVPDGLNFVSAAEKVTPAVVHIKTYYEGNASDYGRNSMEDMLREFFGDQGGRNRGGGSDLQRMSSGSGVIITADGYIATNNHVIEDASKVEVVLDDKRKFEAKVVGTDPTTDLALLKVEAQDLAFVPYGNSDNVKIGQWVLAVGNPFDLTSTVTAGIVSAKGRNINILRGRSNLSIESFIQTDAAVNPGNSGGALVDLNGKLIGINTAIATNTGSYAGYSFAVPVDLAKKVMQDLAEFGEVRRALMGVNIQDVTAELAEEKGIDEIKGVYIAGVAPNGGAEKAGIELGDVILSVDGTAVNSVAELQELVARHRPDEQIEITYLRDGNKKNTAITLQGARDYSSTIADNGSTRKGNGFEIPELGGEFAEISEDMKYNLGIDYGVEVLSLESGKLKDAGLEEGFVIVKVDKQSIETPEDLKKVISQISGGALIEGYNKEGEKEYVGIGF